MSPDLATFLFEGVNFVLLAAGLGWVLFKPVRAALNAERERRDATSREIEAREAAVAKREADAAAARAGFDAELAERRKEALERVRREADESIEAARAEERRRRARLEQELEAKRDALVEGAAQDVASLAAAMVRRLLERLDGPDLDRALVRGACEQLRALGAAPGSASVETARPLDEEAREMLRDAIGAPFEARLVPALGAGVRVTTAAGQVDASARSLTREALRATRAAAAGDGAIPDARAEPSAGDATGGEASAAGATRGETTEASRVGRG